MNLRATQFNAVSGLPIAFHLGGHRAEFLYCGVMGEKWWRNYLHVHSFFEVCFVHAGRGTFQVDETKHRIAPGDLFIARPGQPHEIVSSRQAPLVIYFWAYTLVPAADAPASSSDPALDQLLRAFQASTQAVARVPAIQPTLKLMADEVARRATGYMHVMNALASKLLIDAARAVVPQGVTPREADVRTRSAAESIVQTAVQYLHDNLSRQFEVRDVAAQVALSERQLARIFHKHTGTSILAYLTRLRSERGAQLLMNTQLPIKQVAAAVGYPDTHYFTTLFGRHTGSTPAVFRKSGGTKYLRNVPSWGRKWSGLK